MQAARSLWAHPFLRMTRCCETQIHPYANAIPVHNFVANIIFQPDFVFEVPAVASFLYFSLWYSFQACIKGQCLRVHAYRGELKCNSEVKCQGQGVCNHFVFSFNAIISVHMKQTFPRIIRFRVIWCGNSLSKTAAKKGGTYCTIYAHMRDLCAPWDCDRPTEQIRFERCTKIECETVSQCWIINM